MTDIETLAETARTSGKDEDMNTLWEATFDLEEWYFIAQGEEPNVAPFIGMLEERPLIMAFTSETLARDFAARHNLLDADGGAPLLAIPLEIAVKMTMTLHEHGVFGMLFNDGANGYYAPAENLNGMFEFFVADPDATQGDPEV